MVNKLLTRIGERWLHEIKYDGHRLIAMIDGGGRLSLVSRNGYDRTEPWRALRPARRRAPRTQKSRSRDSHWCAIAP